MSVNTNVRLLTVNGVTVNMENVNYMKCDSYGNINVVFKDGSTVVLAEAKSYDIACYVLEEIMTEFMDESDLIISDDDLKDYIKEAKQSISEK